MIKKTVRLSGHLTSLALEKEFWDALHEISQTKQVSLHTLLSEIDNLREQKNLASQVRLYVLKYYRDKN